MTASDPSNPKAAAGGTKRRRTQEERRENTRSRLLSATLKVLLEKGYSGFRTGDAATVAGVSRGSEIHHFPTKDTLVEAAIAKVFDTELDASKAAAANTSDGDVLYAAGRHAGEFLDSDQYYISFNLVVSAIDNGQLVDKIRTISAQHRDPIEKAWIDRIEALGLSTNDAEDVLSILWNVMRDVSVREWFCEDPRRNHRVIAFALDLLSEHVNKSARS